MQDIESILKISTLPVRPEILGHSEAGRPIHGYRLGQGPNKISLIAGCHADEPVGPLFLNRLTAWLQALPPDHPYIKKYAWWIVPQINPDGAYRNRYWTHVTDDTYSLISYLLNAVREKPEDDIEFGFPVDDSDTQARPENQAVRNWWQKENRPFKLHASLHSMHFAGGPWYLIEPAWKDRIGTLKADCQEHWEKLGYTPHDIDRQGEKGFFRIAKGFCTRPDSSAMKKHFLEMGAPDTAAHFRPSSMETIRCMGGDPLTLVSEMPLFITPGVGVELGPPDPVLNQWRKTITHWKLKARTKTNHSAILYQAEEKGLSSMPISHQMALQWGFITAGIKQLEIDRAVEK